MHAVVHLGQAMEEVFWPLGAQITTTLVAARMATTTCRQHG